MPFSSGGPAEAVSSVEDPGVHALLEGEGGELSAVGACLLVAQAEEEEAVP